MTDLLRRWFQILPEEGSKVLWFAVLAAIMQSGVAIGMVAADSLFLAKLGVEMLPLVFIFMPLVMAVYAPIYSFLVRRMAPRGLFRITLICLIIGGFAFGLSGDRLADETSYLFALKFYAGLWFIALYTLFWNFTDDYFSLLDGKRVYGLISAGGAAGAMAGGGLVAILSGLVPAHQLFLVWAGVAMLAWPIMQQVLKRFRPLTDDEQDESSDPNALKLAWSVGRTFRASRFAVVLALICFSLVSLSTVMEYLYMGVFSAARSADQLTSLLGMLHAAAGGLTLLINLFLFNRIIARLGIANTALILPLTYLAVFVGFYLQPGFAAAVFAFYAVQSLFVSIEYNNINLLYAALPVRAKRELRTFIEAFAEPAATATAGLLLFYFAAEIGTDNLALYGMWAGLIALLVAGFVRHDYVRALSTNLREDWLDFANPEQAWRRQLRRADYQRLQDTARSGSRAQRLLAVDLLWRLRHPAARPLLLDFMSAATADEAERLREPIAALLRDDDTESLAETLLWLESEGAPNDPLVLEEFTGSGAFPVRQVESWRKSADPAHQAALAVARWNGTRLEDVAGAIEDIRQLLAGAPPARRMGIRAIGDCRHSRYYGELFGFLSDPDPDLRLEALRSLRKLASPQTTQMLDKVLPLVRDSRSEERMLILDIAAQAEDATAVPSLMRSADHFSATESRRLEALICGMGLKSIPGLIHVLRAADAPYHSRSIAVRSLARLALPQLAMVTTELIELELGRAEQALLAHRALSANPSEQVGQLVLARYYRDSVAQGLEFILELMSFTGRLSDFDLIRASLQFANPRDRANAIETIQQSCDRDLFQRLALLIDATVSDSGLDVSDQRPLPTVEQVLRQAAASYLPLEASAGIIGYREGGFADPLSLLRSRLDDIGSGQVNDWLISLLPEFTDEIDGIGVVAHPVRRVADLARAEFFLDARIFALELIARQSEECRWSAQQPIYAVNDPAQSLFVVAEGEVELRRQSRLIDTVSAGGTFGQRVLMGDRQRAESAVSLGGRGLAIPERAVMRAIEVFPAVGISLYQFKTQSALA